MVQTRPVETLALLLGSGEAAAAALRRYDVPVRRGRFSVDMLFDRLERYEPRDPIELVRRSLSDIGLDVGRTKKGRPTIMEVTPMRGTVQVGQYEFRDEPDSPFCPLTLPHGETTEVVVYVASARQKNGVANFRVSGLNQDGPPLFALYLLSEGRLWLFLRSELREFEKRVSSGTKVRWFSHSSRPGSLRVALPQTALDFDAARRAWVEEDAEGRRHPSD